MATTRLMPLHVGDGRTAKTAIKDIIDYVENPDKTDGFQLVTSFQCDSRCADAEFMFAKQFYQMNTGRTRGKDDVIAYHLRQAFPPGEITPEEANRLGYELAKRFTKGRHAFVVCTHIDKKHVHNHIIFNSVNLNFDRKFRNFWTSSRAIQRLNDTICIENGYSIVERPEFKGKSYNAWQGDVSKLTHRERLCFAIDEALAQKPASFDALLSLMRAAGYEVKGTSNPSFRGGDQQRFIRLDTLGPAYSMTALKAVISGEKKHTPKRTLAQPKKEKKFDMLVDIQAKLAEGRGSKYESWATKHNLKQIAKTVLFLQQNNINDYDELAEKAAAVSEKSHKIADEIKAMEQRMKEISVLEKHIINYAKTRETYAEYRKAGYSKAFRAEHDHEIRLCQEAKEYFGSLGLEKLPTMKMLKAEYAELLEKKNALYPEYKKAREQAKELLSAKANLELFFGYGDMAKQTKQSLNNPSK